MAGRFEKQERGSVIRGLVSDQATGKPLAGAFVVVTEQGRAVVTGSDGRYELGGLSAGEVESLMHAAHEVCPYSNATRGNIEVALDVV